MVRALPIARIVGGVLGGWLAIMAPAVVTLALRLRDFDSTGMPSFYALMLALGWLTMLTALIALGMLGDRLRARTGSRVLLARVAVPLLLMSGVALALAPDPATLLGVWLLAQIPASAVVTTALAESGDHLPAGSRGLTSGLVGAASIVALLLGSVIVRLAGDTTQAGFIIPTVLGAALAAPLMMRVDGPAGVAAAADSEATTQAAGVAPEAVRHLLRAWPVFVVASFLLSWATSTTNGFVVTFVQYLAEAAEDQVAVTATGAVILASGCAVLASLVAGPLLGVHGRAPLTWVTGAVTCSLALLLMIALPTGAVFLAAAAAFGIGFGIANGVELAVILTLRPDADQLGLHLGLFTAATTAPYVLVPAVASAILVDDPRIGVTVLFLAAAIAAAIGAVLTARTTRAIRTQAGLAEHSPAGR